MDKNLFREIIQQLRPYLFNLNLHFQGEPMLHPEFFTLAGISKGIPSTLHTNGHFLDEENALRLIKSGIRNVVVSVDGMDQETYSSYRVKGDLSTVLRGIEDLSRINTRNGSHLNIRVQMLLNMKNEHQVGEAREFVRKNNVKLSLKSMQVIDPSGAEKWLPSDKKFRRYEKTAGSYRIRNSLPSHCARLWFNPVITWDGLVVPCCFDKDALYVMGDLKSESFRTIWNGKRYAEFRTMLLGNRKKIPICQNCTSGIINVKT